MSDNPSLDITSHGPNNFSLTVIYDGRRFDCGTYISRPAAMLAGRLFIDRKQGEDKGRKKRARKQK